MAGTVILNRTVFVEKDANGYFRFQDWALVTTTLGAMVELFSPNARFQPGTGFANFDPTDDLSLITEIKNVDSDLLPTHLSGGGPVFNGGISMPRSGR